MTAATCRQDVLKAGASRAENRCRRLQRQSAFNSLVSVSGAKMPETDNLTTSLHSALKLLFLSFRQQQCPVWKPSEIHTTSCLRLLCAHCGNYQCSFSWIAGAGRRSVRGSVKKWQQTGKEMAQCHLTHHDAENVQDGAKGSGRRRGKVLTHGWRWKHLYTDNNTNGDVQTHTCVTWNISVPCVMSQRALTHPPGHWQHPLHALLVFRRSN